MSFEFNDVIDLRGYIVPDVLAEKLHITKKEFAVAVGIRHEALLSKRRRESVTTQQRLCQAVEILKRIEPWAGSLSAAWSWYRSYPIAPLGSLTAEELVPRGRGHEVREYLSHIAEGGYT